MACSGSSRLPPAPSGPPASLVATRTSADDVQVATVNGRPIWGSCVAAQAARGASKQDALAQCIDFELLAQAAEARGLAIDREVVDATRTALVSQLVAYDFEAKYTGPQAFGPLWDRLVGRNRQRIDHAEYRGSMYARIELAKTATPAQEAAARATAEDIARTLAPEHGLMPSHFRDLVERAAAGRAKLKIELIKPYLHSALDKAYADALWKLREVGDVSPAIRTAYGYDVIMLAEHIPEARPTLDEAVRELLPDVQRAFFPTWTNQVKDRLGAKVQILETNLPLLESI